MKKAAVGALLVLFTLVVIQVWLTPQGSTPAWRAHFDREILTAPCRLRDHIAVLGDRREIALLDRQGQVVARQPLPRPPRHPLIALPSAVVVADREAGLRAYNAETLTLRWERATLKTSPLPPQALPGDRLLVPTDARTLIAVEGRSGDPLWDIQLPTPVQHTAVGRAALACTYGQDDGPGATFRLQVYDLEDGAPLWSFPGPVAIFPPIPTQDLFLFVTSQGSVVGAEQETGALRLRLDSPGLHHVFAEGDTIGLVASDGRQVIGASLSGRRPWTARLGATFLAAKVVGDLVMLADRSGLQCLDVSTGEVVWRRDLGPILTAHPHRRGMAVLYKSSFLDRHGSFAYLPAATGEPAWICVENAMFHPPLPDGRLDLVFCRNGAIYGMPVPKSEEPPPVTPTAAEPAFPRPATPTFDLPGPGTGFPPRASPPGAPPDRLPDQEPSSGWD